MKPLTAATGRLYGTSAQKPPMTDMYLGPEVGKYAVQYSQDLSRFQLLTRAVDGDGAPCGWFELGSVCEDTVCPTSAEESARIAYRVEVCDAYTGSIGEYICACVNHYGNEDPDAGRAMTEGVADLGEAMMFLVRFWRAVKSTATVSDFRTLFKVEAALSALERKLAGSGRLALRVSSWD